MKRVRCHRVLNHVHNVVKVQVKRPTADAESIQHIERPCISVLLHEHAISHAAQAEALANPGVLKSLDRAQDPSAVVASHRRDAIGDRADFRAPWLRVDFSQLFEFSTFAVVV